MATNPIQWFPGHMAKTRRVMQECLPQVDLVLELLDSRIPYSSKNPEIEKMLGTKPKIIVLTKASMANPALTRAWENYYKSKDMPTVVIDSQAQAAKRAQEGYTYQQERGFDVAQDAAKNEGAGQFTNMGIGLGMMAGVGGGIANMVGGAVNTAFNGVNTQPQAQPSAPADTFCENCGAKLTPGAAFCDECGTKVAVPDNVCRNCGYQFERPGKFCPKCGTKREG